MTVCIALLTGPCAALYMSLCTIAHKSSRLPASILHPVRLCSLWSPGWRRATGPVTASLSSFLPYTLLHLEGVSTHLLFPASSYVGQDTVPGFSCTEKICMRQAGGYREPTEEVVNQRSAWTTRFYELPQQVLLLPAHACL